MFDRWCVKKGDTVTMEELEKGYSQYKAYESMMFPSSSKKSKKKKTSKDDEKEVPSEPKIKEEDLVIQPYSKVLSNKKVIKLFDRYCEEIKHEPDNAKQLLQLSFGPGVSRMPKNQHCTRVFCFCCGDFECFSCQLDRSNFIMLCAR